MPYTIVRMGLAVIGDYSLAVVLWDRRDFGLSRIPAGLVGAFCDEVGLVWKLFEDLSTLMADDNRSGQPLIAHIINAASS